MRSPRPAVAGCVLKRVGVASEGEEGKEQYGTVLVIGKAASARLGLPDLLAKIRVNQSTGVQKKSTKVGR